ncbi:consortin [Hemiscyllium ocellatum]|uniref:consortin n=1 Tax=Hemiscyllium ocellatum TaxID=170820 RepID=UPI002965EE83|nr:consortin [Hemiscyllium ocellatum]XP_060686794.1 consortin [Hemiscyllium ocellatum]XP_060686795.1 consortin [Hemiscyllium ocellatum]
MDEGGSHSIGTTEKNGSPKDVEKPGATNRLSSLISDENENRIRETQSSPFTNDRMGGFEQTEQDVINNNDDNDDKTGFEVTQNNCMDAGCEISNSIANQTAELPQGIETVRTCDSEMERNLKTATSGASEETTDNSSEFLCRSLNTVLYDRSSQLEVNCQQVDRKRLLQTLLSSVQRETELNDSYRLPYYLHQIAEIYFDEEEYEKAIQFIQLEKLYHQKFLANLTAIQEGWEVKQKAAIAKEVTEGRSVKALDDKIVKLSEFCASHSRPNLSEDKGEDAYRKDTVECNSRFTDQPIATSREQSAECEDASLEFAKDRKKDCLASVRIALAVDKSTERDSAMYYAESSLDEQVEADRAKGMMHFDIETEHLSSANTEMDKSCFQLHATMPCKDIVTRAQQIESEGFSEAGGVIHAGPLFHAEETENLHGDLKFAGKTTEENVQTQLLECNKPIKFITDGLAVSKQSNHVFQKHVESDSNDCVNKETMSGNSEESMRIDDQATKQNQTDVLNEINEYEQISEKVASKAEEEIQCNAALNENRMSYEGSEKWGEDEYVEAFCNSVRGIVSPGQKNDTDELLQLNDSSLSLDELAKRIQIEENTHPEGLVSILKKRNLDKEITRVQQKQSKRRVRFQEPQDTLEQDEVNGDSCLLLVLLCIVTVLLSVGGTALYCTFGDLDSSVCRDFTTQMNFYYAQFQQGVEKVKHWLLFS